MFETPGGRREIPPYRVARPKRRKSPFPLSSNACSPNQASFESETSDRNHKAELASHPPSPFPVTSGRRCPSHPASFHSPRAFKSWSARPAPSSAASSPPDHLRKRPTDRQAAGERPPTRCPERRPQHGSSGDDRRGLVARQGPSQRAFLRSVTDADKRTGRDDPCPERPWARYDDRTDGRRILDSPPIRGGPQANVRRREHPLGEILRDHLPAARPPTAPPPAPPPPQRPRGPEAPIGKL